MMQNTDWQLPPDFSREYLEACKLAATDDEAFANFRKNDRISCIIENTSQEWADQALKKMGYQTPTMIRYMYIVQLMAKLFGNDVYGIDEFVEIGAGYGGQCKAIFDFGFLPSEYFIYDLPEVCLLQKRYLADFHLISKVKWINGLLILPVDKEPFLDKKYLCLSWCAWSELIRPLREAYFEKVISKCDHIFIASNYNTQEDIEILSRKFDVRVYSDDLVSNVLYA